MRQVTIINTNIQFIADRLAIINHIGGTQRKIGYKRHRY